MHMALRHTLKADGLYAQRRGDVATPIRAVTDDPMERAANPRKSKNGVIEKD